MEPDIETFDLDTDFEQAAAELERGVLPKFALRGNRFHVVRAKALQKRARRGIKKLIHPDNARCVIEHLPDPGDRTHAILRGDFVLCDLIPVIIAERGRCEHLHVATLGLSTANAEVLASLRARDLVGGITIVCSHYFAQVDKATTYREVTARLEGLATIVTTRCHAKVICLPIAGADFVIEGSANLRSSDNTEQIVIFNDAETLQFHRGWMEELKEAHHE